MAKRDLKKAEARMGELLEQVQGLNAASKARNREMDDLKSMHYKVGHSLPLYWVPLDRMPLYRLPVIRMIKV